MTIYAGAIGPESMTITINGGSSGLNLATVIAVSAVVSSPSGTITWSFAPPFVTQTGAQIVVRRVFASSNTDVPVAGSYTARVSLTFPDGVRRAAPSQFQVKEY